MQKLVEHVSPHVRAAGWEVGTPTGNFSVPGFRVRIPGLAISGMSGKPVPAGCPAGLGRGISGLVPGVQVYGVSGLLIRTNRKKQ